MYPWRLIWPANERMQLTWLLGAPSRPASVHRRAFGQTGLGSPATQLMRAVSPLFPAQKEYPQEVHMCCIGRRIALIILFSATLIGCSSEVIVTDTQVSPPTALATTTSEPSPTIEVPTAEIVPSATTHFAVAPTPTVAPAAD